MDIQRSKRDSIRAITQCRIELDTIIPLAHQNRYKLNPNYATTIKQYIDKLLLAEFIEYVEEAT